MKKEQSFTLVEILVAMLIIGILSSFVITRSSDSTTHAELARGKAFGLSVLTSLPSNFVSEWKFDGPTPAGSNATTNDVKDTWGGNDASISSAPVVRGGSDCISSNCIEFDGTDDYLTITDSDTLDLTGNYTFSFWAYNNNGSKTYPTFFNRAAQSSSNGYFWCYTGGTNEVDVNFQWANGSTNLTTFSNVFPVNAWTYFVFTFNNSTKVLKLYKNGAYTNDPKTLTSAYAVDDGTLYIGTYGGSTVNYPFKGKLDEFRIFNDVLAIANINSNYFIGVNKLLLNKEISINEHNQRIGELKLNLTKNE